ncbi:hypothetical protein HK100_012596 [Physocladia obscura]|uniref:C2H2-type domain-containing protein n=1 Tax=Physocladia obscura TaxID=109957 RepID=A0AAD5T241_9FUNG|nr:hypothetical protein HK100_012596 [Physocladia obscura]
MNRFRQTMDSVNSTIVGSNDSNGNDNSNNSNNGGDGGDGTRATMKHGASARNEETTAEISSVATENLLRQLLLLHNSNSESEKKYKNNNNNENSDNNATPAVSPTASQEAGASTLSMPSPATPAPTPATSSGGTCAASQNPIALLLSAPSENLNNHPPSIASNAINYFSFNNNNANISANNSANYYSSPNIVLAPASPRKRKRVLSSSVGPFVQKPRSNSTSSTGSVPGPAKASVGLHEKTYPCLFPNCGKVFPRAYNLKSHSFCHSGDRPHVCNVCSAAFSRKHDLQRHVRTIHADDKVTPEQKVLRDAFLKTRREVSSSPSELTHTPINPPTKSVGTRSRSTRTIISKPASAPVINYKHRVSPPRSQHGTPATFAAATAADWSLSNTSETLLLSPSATTTPIISVERHHQQQFEDFRFAPPKNEMNLFNSASTETLNAANVLGQFMAHHTQQQQDQQQQRHDQSRVIFGGTSTGASPPQSNPMQSSLLYTIAESACGNAADTEAPISKTEAIIQKRRASGTRGGGIQYLALAAEVEIQRQQQEKEDRQRQMQQLQQKEHNQLLGKEYNKKEDRGDYDVNEDEHLTEDEGTNIAVPL